MIAFLVTYKLKGTDPRKDLTEEHLRYLQILYADGRLLAAGKFLDKVGGYLLFHTASIEETKTLVEQDPYIAHGAREYEIEGWDMSPFPLRLKEQNRERD